MNPTYAYVYDDFLGDRRFEREVAALETKLSTFDLSGHIGRMSLFRSAKDLVESMVAKGVKTVVIVGNDGTLDKTMWFLPDLPVTIGYIPLVGPSAFGELLGIPTGVAACDVLAARRIETLDMGKIDDRYFLTEVSLPATAASLSVEGKYSVSPTHGGSLAIRNLGGRMNGALVASDPRDGLLEVIVIPRATERKTAFWKKAIAIPETRMFFKHGEIVSTDPIEANVDNHAVSGFRFVVKVVPGVLKLITGRNRVPLVQNPKPAGQ